MNICVYGASSNAIDKSYIEAIEALGECIARHGHGLVFGGGNGGAMGAAARGADRVEGAHIIGVAPTFFPVDGVLYPHCTEFHYTETMRERKKLLEDMSDAFIIAPGGVGTFDELFEILTLKQLGRHNKPMVLFNVNGYYDPLIAMLEHAAEGKFLNETTIELVRVFDTLDGMMEYIEGYDEPMHLPSFFKKIEEAKEN